MNEMWFALVQEEQLGPMSFEEVIDFYYKDIINAETLLWTDGFEGWCPITHIKEFADLLFQGAVLTTAQKEAQDDSELETSLFQGELPPSFVSGSAFGSMDELKDEDLNAEDIAFLEDALGNDHEGEEPSVSSPFASRPSQIPNPPTPPPTDSLSLLDDIPLMSLDELIVSAKPDVEDSSYYKVQQTQVPSLAGQPSLVSRPVKKGGGKLLFLIFGMGMGGTFFFQDIKEFTTSIIHAHMYAEPTSPPIEKTDPVPPVIPSSPSGVKLADTSPVKPMVALNTSVSNSTPAPTRLLPSSADQENQVQGDPLETNSPQQEALGGTQKSEEDVSEEMVFDEEIEIEFEEMPTKTKKGTPSQKKVSTKQRRRKNRRKKRKINTKKPQKTKTSPQTSRLPSQLGRSDIENARNKVLPAIKSCAAKDPKLGKHLSVVMTIMRTGRLSKVKAVTRSLRESTQKNCIINVIRSMKFPPFSGENMRVTLPIKL